ncbi:MAG: hypothetical protein KC731_36540 [Myxococcales bacterium]|nr:hypothetical protein [Myxococcales bacterium]
MAEADERRYHTPIGELTHAQLRERVRVMEPGIVYFRELPGGDCDNFEAMLGIVRELGEPMGTFVVIIDLGDATRPSPALLEKLLEATRTIGIRWCAVQSTSRLMKAVVEFVLRRMLRNKPHTVHSSLEEALVEARRALAEHRSDSMPS